MKRIDAPTLLLIGENDDVAVEHARKMERIMPHAALEVIPNVGHNVPQAAALEVLSGMLNFFNRH